MWQAGNQKEKDYFTWAGDQSAPDTVTERHLGNISTTRPYEAEWPFPYRAGLVRATRPGTTIKVRFRGRLFGTWGPGAFDGGNMKVTIDGNDAGTKSMHWQWGKPAMGPSGWGVFAMDLEPGNHVAELVIAEEKPEGSEGYRVEIGYLLVEP